MMCVRRVAAAALGLSLAATVGVMRPTSAARAEGLAELQCVQAAEADVPLDAGEAQRLCRDASSRAPAACFAAAVERTFLDEFQAIRLCRGAASLAPVDCFARAQEDATIDRTEALSLCRTNALAPAPLVPRVR